MKQLLLPLSLPHTFEERDFIITDSNQEAYLWIKRWPDWPSHTLALYGDEGCGKTHLAHLWGCYGQALKLKGDEFNKLSLDNLLSAPPFFVIENADLTDSEEKFFHLYNHIIQSNGGLLLLSQTAPAHWNIDLPDLSSRLSVIPAIKIQSPDDDLLGQVIRKQFNDLQLSVDDNVIAYLLKHIERSFESARLWVNQLNRIALMKQRNITISLVREILQTPSQDDIYL